MKLLTTIRKIIGYGLIVCSLLVGFIGAYLAIDEEDFQS